MQTYLPLQRSACQEHRLSETESKANKSIGLFGLSMRSTKNIPVDSGRSSDKDSLTNLYLQHIIPLPQRELPSSRWGKKMERRERSQSLVLTVLKIVCVADGSRKRPLIVFDGSSTSTTIKIKKTELGESNRLKPPPSGNLTNTIRRLSSPLSCSSPSVQSNSTIHRDGELDKNVVPNNQNLSGNCKSPPATVGTGCVKLKRAAPKDGESDVAVSMIYLNFC
uniref:Ashwin n=1 Tax=Erpetoichthys calabaricus TaxID=27687 RepID=A0A8C4X3I7_ERPCA